MTRKQRIEPVVRIAPLGELKVWPIYEHELDLLARGTPGSVLLNFALALLPFAGGLVLALFTAVFPSTAVFTVFVSLSVISALVGLICLALWWQNHVSTRALVEQIKRRMPPPEGIQENAAD